MRRLLILILLLSPLAFAGDAVVIRDFPFAYSGYVDVNHGGLATMWIDFSQDPSGATITTSDGGYTLTKAGAPARVNDGTYPSGLSTQGYAHRLDGAADYWYRADDGTFDFGDDFTIHAAITPDTVAAGEDCIVAKYETTDNKKSWKLCRSADGIVFTMSADGSTDTTVTKASCLAAHRPAFITATYDKSGTTADVYVDNLAVATSGAAAADLYDTTANLEVGASDTGATLWDGLISELVLVPAYKTEADHLFAWRQYQGRMSTTTNVASVTSAAPPAVIMAPPASGTEPFIIPQPANASYIGSPATGSGGIYGAAAITNLIYRSAICETQDGSSHPQGWVTAETAGDGSAAVDCSTDTVAHGARSLKVVLTGTTSAANITSACITTGIGSDVYLSAYNKCTSGTCASRLGLAEYDNADCTANLAFNAVLNFMSGTDWEKQDAVFAAGSWNGATSSFTIYLNENGNGGTTAYWNSPQLRVASTPTDAFCGSDADAAAVCTILDVTSGSEALSAASWTITATVRSPIDGAEATPVRTILRVPATAGDNNKITASWASDTLTLSVFDSAGAEKTSTVAAAGNADTDYDIVLKKNAMGQIWACWEGTCDATPGTAALTDGVGSEIVIGSDGTTGGDVWVRDLKIYRRVLP